MNTGGIRQDLVFNQISGGEQPGEVTYGELFTVQPFGNPLETVTMTGLQIKRVLEQQFQGGNGILQVSKGFTYTQDRYKAVGDRIDPDTMRLNGVKMDMNANYRVTGNAFLIDGGDNYTDLHRRHEPHRRAGSTTTRPRRTSSCSRRSTGRCSTASRASTRRLPSTSACRSRRRPRRTGRT